jgi:hypothetical protein
VIEGDVEYVIRALGGGQRVEVRVLERAEEAMQLLKEMPEITGVSLEQENGNGQVIHADFTGNDLALHQILARLIAKNVLVVSFAPLKAVERLEDVYMNVMEGVATV